MPTACRTGLGRRLRANSSGFEHGAPKPPLFEFGATGNVEIEDLQSTKWTFVSSAPERDFLSAVENRLIGRFSKE